ncbi:hypothetical protein PMIN01_07390 [Paraphaeosphaeria minitans]|uniref:Uncharacterized protein n=1 Tax=Paraphaeosphaeria minitans TaxID=565426 RepID=A0A9P6GF70_9PLEO|nr:hypothetical protein PMIN01_07390 [Paraphaeosphaeria minitans]
MHKHSTPASPASPQAQVPRPRSRHAPIQHGMASHPSKATLPIKTARLRSSTAIAERLVPVADLVETLPDPRPSCTWPTPRHAISIGKPNDASRDVLLPQGVAGPRIDVMGLGTRRCDSEGETQPATDRLSAGAQSPLLGCEVRAVAG